MTASVRAADAFGGKNDRLAIGQDVLLKIDARIPCLILIFEDDDGGSCSLGAALPPFSAFRLIQGIETVALRMERHCANAVSVAKYLAQHPAVVRVIHPSQ